MPGILTIYSSDPKEFLVVFNPLGDEFSNRVISSIEEAIDLEDLFSFQVILCEVVCGRTPVLHLLDFLKGMVPVIVVGKSSELELMTAALEAGAMQYVIQGQDNSHYQLFPSLVRNAIQNHYYKKMLLERNQQDEPFKQLIQNLPDIIYKIDPNGFFTFISESIRILGYEPHDLIGKHFKTLLHPEDIGIVSREAFLKESPVYNKGDDQFFFDERRRGHRKTRNLEVRLIPKSWNPSLGRTPVLIASVIAFGEVNAQGHYHNWDNAFLGTVGIIRDITSRKKSEEMLRIFYEALDQSPLSIIIADSQGMIEYVNPHFLHQGNFEPGDIIGKDISILKFRRILQNSVSGFDELIAGMSEWQGEILEKKENGEEIWESVIIKSVYSPEGAISHYLIIKLDISEQKAAEDVLKTINQELDKRVEERTAELESMYRDLRKEIEERKRIEEERRILEAQLQRSQKLETIGTLAGGVAHDFNNILTPILGFSNIALMELRPEDKIYSDILEIRNAASRARDIVQQLLTFSKKVEHERMAVNLLSIVEEVLTLLRATIPASIEVQKNFLPGNYLIIANPSQIHQVIMNLCTNAYQAMKNTNDGFGTLGLKLSTYDPGAGIPPGNLESRVYVQLDISDTGIGIPGDNLQKIFDPFFTTKEKGEGTGLGLSVAHGIISSHNGDIFVESTPGRGTCFSVFLPVFDGVKVSEPEKEEEYPMGNEHILYIDDELPVARTLERMLKLLGYKVTHCQNGIAALELFSREPDSFQLILTDLTMPKVSGLEVAAEIRKKNSTIPIILITGYGEKEVLLSGEKLGIYACIDKPVSLKDLSFVVHGALKGE